MASSLPPTPAGVNQKRARPARADRLLERFATEARDRPPVDPSILDRAPGLPRRVHCAGQGPGGGFEDNRKRTADAAKLYPHIQVNSDWLKRYLVFDVDGADAAGRWEAAGLPPPRWEAVNPHNGHVHAAWELAVPVNLRRGFQSPAVRLAALIEAALCRALGADPSYVGLLTKNPLHPTWDVKTWPSAPSLMDLKTALGGDRALRRARPDTAAEETGIGRSYGTFHRTRRHAYHVVGEYWEAGRLAAFEGHCQDWAAEDTLKHHGRAPVRESLTDYIGRKVAGWTWEKRNPDAFAGRQSALGARGGRKGKGGRPRLYEPGQEPWTLAGISRRTWYRQRSRQ